MAVISFFVVWILGVKRSFPITKSWIVVHSGQSFVKRRSVWSDSISCCGKAYKDKWGSIQKFKPIMVIDRSKVNEQRLKNFLVTLQHHPFTCPEMFRQPAHTRKRSMRYRLSRHRFFVSHCSALNSLPSRVAKSLNSKSLLFYENTVISQPFYPLHFNSIKPGCPHDSRTPPCTIL